MGFNIGSIVRFNEKSEYSETYGKIFKIFDAYLFRGEMCFSVHEYTKAKNCYSYVLEAELELIKKDYTSDYERFYDEHTQH